MTILPIFNPKARINERSPEAVGRASRASSCAALAEERLFPLGRLFPREAVLATVSRAGASDGLADGGNSGLKSSTEWAALWLLLLMSSSSASIIFLTEFLPTRTVVTVGFVFVGCVGSTSCSAASATRAGFEG